MPILPLPQFEADLAELQRDREDYERLNAPKSIVVRFGRMKLVGEYPYDGSAKPGCGSKLVVRTHRGTELAEMLTTTCPNSGCGKSVSRKDLLKYVENSGGKDYPFFNQGKVLHVATLEDLNEQARLESLTHQQRKAAQEVADRLNLQIKVIDVEPLLGQERLTIYYGSEERIDFRAMVAELADLFHARIEMRQIGARDEARVTADYERCGQHCCCKQFLKVLKPISMRSAKVQKATLDPLKISGRCGRLMCCLRYEDQTYTDLQKRLPKRKSRVYTEEGPGIVIDTQILTQLVLVRLEGVDRDIAVPVENISKTPIEGAPSEPPPPPQPRKPVIGRAPSAPGSPPSRAAFPTPRKDGSSADNAETTTDDAPTDVNAPIPQQGKPRRRDRDRDRDRNRDRGRDARRPNPTPPGQPGAPPVDRPRITPPPADPAAPNARQPDRAPAGPDLRPAGPGAPDERTGEGRRRRRRRGGGGRGDGPRGDAGPANDRGSPRNPGPRTDNRGPRDGPPPPPRPDGRTRAPRGPNESSGPPQPPPPGPAAP